MKIKTTLLILGLASLCLAANADQETTPREKRVLSLFSIVQFPNDECTTTDVNVKTGVCTTSTECTAGSGTQSGNCASGFGVCCIYKTNECGTTISKNISYIQNPSFPSTYSTTGTCSYKITKTVSDICQVRLDFDTMVLGGNGIGGSHAGCCGSTCGTTAGDHAADSLTVTGKTGRDPPVICHTNTGHHMYVEVGTEDADQVSLDFYMSDTQGSTTTLGTNLRKWNIKVTQIACGTTHTAPHDCVQWYTGVEGTVQSYGFGSGQLLSSQNYQACVRQEEGYCGIEWYPSSRTSPDSFGLLHGSTTTAGFGESTIGTCVSSYVNIPGAITYPNSLHTINNMCGEGWAKDGTAADLGPLRSFQTPFRFDVFSDKSVAKVLASTGNPVATGFEMVYRQLPCGIGS